MFKKPLYRLGLLNKEAQKSGNVTINGVSLKKCDLKEIRKTHIGVSEQEPSLLNDTIAANLFLGDTEDRVSYEFVLDILDMEPYINRLPDKLNTVITAKNNNLSGGEKQKISIARVLLRNPDIMVFDEPTSALDSKATEQFIQYLVNIKSSKIILIVTHSSDIINICDEVVDLRRVSVVG